MGERGTRYKGRLCMPDVDDLRRQILDEGHGSDIPFIRVPPKMYRDLQEVYWWNSLNRDIRNLFPNVLIVNKSRPNIKDREG